MEQEKNNKGLIALVIILCLLVLGMGGYIVYDKKISDKEIPTNETTNNEISNNQSTIINDKETTTNETTNNVVSNNQSSVGNNYNVTIKNEREATLDDIKVKVENGNIKFTNGSKEKVFSSVNAKYIFLVSYMDSANTRLYYITNNNELYYKNLFPFASNTFFDKEITNYGIKIVDNVVGFIENKSANKYDSEGKVVESYPLLTVLLSDGTTYSVNYAS